jgi:hypothetical protein
MKLSEEYFYIEVLQTFSICKKLEHLRLLQYSFHL